VPGPAFPRAAAGRPTRGPGGGRPGRRVTSRAARVTAVDLRSCVTPTQRPIAGSGRGPMADVVDVGSRGPRSGQLVIDPGLEHSTSLGGSLDDEPLAAAVDSPGNAYVTGRTYSIDFPVAGTPAQAVKAGFTNRTDVFVTKLAPTSALVYSTYFGGGDDDSGAGIAVDGGGKAYVTGFALSLDFPTAGTPSQGTKAGLRRLPRRARNLSPGKAGGITSGAAQSG
jgi:hypothetical protein